jgi:outer membrane protein TolC
MTVPAVLLAGWVALAGCRTGAPAKGDDAAGTGDALTLGAIVVERPPEGVDAGGDDSSSLSLVEAVRRTVEHDPRIQVALAKVRSARADSSQARLLPNPVLSVAVRFREGGGTPIYELGLAADLVSLLQRPRQTSAADNKLRAAVRDVMADVLDACAEAHEAYAAARAVEQELAALRERRGRSERLVRIGRARLEAGEATSLDVIALQTQQLAIDVDIADKEAERAEARLALARLIGAPGGRLDWELEPARPIEPANDAEAGWVDAGLRTRPELLSKRWELAALGDEAALSAWAPWEGGDVGGHAEYDDGWSVGPSLTTPLPLFDWGQAKRAKAKAARLVARYEMTGLRRKVVEEVRSAYARYVASTSALRTARDTLLPLEQKRADQTRAAYEAGEADVTRLIVAEDDLEDARVKVIDLEKKTAVAAVKLLRAAGGGAPRKGNP